MRASYTAALVIAALVLSALLSGCGGQERAAEVVTITADPKPAAEETAPVPAATPAPTPEKTAAPTPTQAPRARARIAFAGDIMVMTSQITAAKKSDGSYDFSPSFSHMKDIFASFDYVCGNFECTLAGAEAGYTEPKPSRDPAETPSDSPRPLNQTFNAPDGFASTLRDAGFDLISTVNNHAMDRGLEGLVRTAEKLREAGLTQLGTFVSAEDAATPRVEDINGIAVGFVAAADYINSGTPSMGEAGEYAVLLTRDREAVAEAIGACREAGAEFIIVIVHWGTEHSETATAAQESYADFLIGAGADAIIGSHPHVAEPVEWREAPRGEGTATAPVIYSLGNFLSNMTQKNCEYGMLAGLTLEKDGEGVRCVALTILPTLSARENGQRTVLPADISDEGEKEDAFGHISEVCAGDGIIIAGREDYAGKTQIVKGEER